MLSLLKCAFISCLLAVLASSEPCDIKSFGSHHCHLDMSNLTSAKVTTPPSARLLYVLQALVWTTLNGVLQALVAHR